MKRMWSEEEIQSFKKDISNLVDSKGNPRFIEGEGTPETITGFTSTYCKWSLSGTHLMIILTATIASGTTLTNGQTLATFVFPDFIKNKIIPYWGDNYIERKATTFFPATSSESGTQTSSALLGKFTNILIQQSGDITLTANRSVRIQFDLLIDNE